MAQQQTKERRKPPGIHRKGAQTRRTPVESRTGERPAGKRKNTQKGPQKKRTGKDHRGEKNRRQRRKKDSDGQPHGKEKQQHTPQGGKRGRGTKKTPRNHNHTVIKQSQWMSEENVTHGRRMKNQDGLKHRLLHRGTYDQKIKSKGSRRTPGTRKKARKDHGMTGRGRRGGEKRNGQPKKGKGERKREASIPKQRRRP
ncbi:MAG: hypothetical protein U5K54_27340 [Cytophagales bacterium]|nr:hypothetical protein [Cytophagales bacterium]